MDPHWYLLTAVVGVNLLQSGWTKWCPVMVLFRKMGLKNGDRSGGNDETGHDDR